jgi:hypothetical protein
MQRRHHYEQAFEEYLRSRRIPYVAVDEARKALLPDRVRGHAAGPNDATVPEDVPAALKSFDFVLYTPGGNLLAEVKGRKVIARSQSRTGRRSPGRLECWATQDDVDALTTWEGLFGVGFCAVLVFVYWCDEQPAMPLFEELFEFKGRWYAIRTITVRDYRSVMRPRSARWRTVHVGQSDFDRLAVSMSERCVGRRGAECSTLEQHSPSRPR